MGSFFRNVANLLWQAGQQWVENDAPKSSAALSFYTLFSLAPILVVVLAIVGAIWGGQTQAVQAEFMEQTRELLGTESAATIKAILASAESPIGTSILTSIIGGLVFLVAATALFAQLQSALNDAWKISKPATFSLRGVIRRRLLSFGLIVAIGFVLLVSLAMSAALSSVQELLFGPEGLSGLVSALNMLVSFGITTFMFAAVFKILPDAKTAWKDVLVGATFTAFLFAIGKEGIGVYLGRSNAASSFGAAGSLVVLLLWVYYASMIVLFGAEVTQSFARQYGKGLASGPELAEKVDEPAKLGDEGSR